MRSRINHNLIIFFVGIFAVVMGIISLLFQGSTDAKNTAEAAAVVTGYVTEEEYDSSDGFYYTVYRPAVRFTAGGTEVEAVYSQNYSSEEFPVGESVQIHYDPDHPENFTIDSDRRGTFAAAWEIPAGVLLILLAVGSARKKHREEM